MSIEISKRVWGWSKAEGNIRLVLLALAEHASPEGHCWPGIKRLARMCRVSERTVQRSLRELQKLGEVIVEQESGRPCNGGHTNRYQVTVKSIRDRPPATSDDTKGGDKMGKERVTLLTPPPVTALSPKPSVESSEENTITTPECPAGTAGNVIAPLELFSEKRHIPPIPSTPLPPDRLDQFCDALIKLRLDFTGGRPVPSLTPSQRTKIQEGLALYANHSLKRLLWLFGAAWQHWECVKDLVKAKRFVEGFHAKFFWPPEQGFKHLDKIEDFLYDEGDANPEWWESIKEDVKKAMATSSTLIPEARK